MAPIDAYITIAITMMSVAYPLLLQVISRLDGKYSSVKIIELFEKENESKWFKRFIVISILLLGIWSFGLSPIQPLQNISWYIDHSADVAFEISVVFLVIFFFRFVSKVLIYYTPSKLVKYLINEHKESPEDEDIFGALSDVFLMSIRLKDPNTPEELRRWFYDRFKMFRAKSNGPVVYPKRYYELVYTAIEELSKDNSNRNRVYETSTSGSIWILGDESDHIISEETMIWLWRNILLAIRENRYDLIFMHWRTAEQYFDYKLKLINPKYQDISIPVNMDDIKDRESMRRHFLDFHYALGGLLLFSGKYSLIERFFKYTRGHPPSYPLLPADMTEIFEQYSRFRDPYDIEFSWISSRFGFPVDSGIESDNIVKGWIMKYFAVLFLRQWSIPVYLIIQRPLELPKLPNDQGVKKQWIEGLKHFNLLVNELLSDDEFINSLNFSFLTKEWCELKGHKYPLDFISVLKDELEKSYAIEAGEIQIDTNKKQQFFQSSSYQIESEIDLYSSVNSRNETEIQDEDLLVKWKVNGRSMLQSRDSFSISPEVTNMNYDSFLGSRVSSDISRLMAQTFLLNKSKEYLLKREEIFTPLKRMKYKEPIVIVSFGLDVNWYRSNYKIEGLSENSFNGIQIIQYASNSYVREGIFVLKQSEFPSLRTLPVDPDMIKKYDLTNISDTYEIWSSVLPLNEAKAEVRADFVNERTDHELDISVLLSIHLNLEIEWSKSTNMIYLRIYSEYHNKGLPQDAKKVNLIMP